MEAQRQMREPINLELLIKLMRLTTSSTDGEALAAIRMANRHLGNVGGDWEELLRGKLAPIDPFASLPEPPPVVKPTPPPPRQPMASHSYHGGSSPSPPPPPKLWGLDKKEAKDITTWLVACEFASLDPHTTRQIQHIDLRWRTNKSLADVDYATLRDTAAKVKRNTRRP